MASEVGEGSTLGGGRMATLLPCHPTPQGPPGSGLARVRLTANTTAGSPALPPPSPSGPQSLTDSFKLGHQFLNR